MGLSLNNRIAVMVMVLLSSLCAQNYFGNNPQLGDTYGTFRVDKIHDGLDIHNVTEVRAIETGEFYYDARESGFYFFVTVGKWVYGHIRKDPNLPVILQGQGVNTGISVSHNTLLGIPITAPSGQEEHIHVMYGTLGAVLRRNRNGHYITLPVFHPEKNPIVKLNEHSFSLPDSKDPKCGGFKFEPFEPSKDQASEYNGHWTLKGGVDILGNVWDESDWSDQQGWTPRLAPFEIWWVIERLNPEPEQVFVSGHFFFKGKMPYVDNPNNKKLKKEIYKVSGKTANTRISHICDVEGSVTNLETSFNEAWHWNTLQSVHSIGDDPDKRPWHFTVDPCNDPDSLLFPDGEYRVSIKLRDFADNAMGYYTDVTIKNVPPLAKATREPGGYRRPMTDEGNNLYAYFSEPMDTTSFTDNIDIRALCRNMASVNIDSMRFSEDLTELTMFLPDTFPGNEAYHVELTNEITDIAGTPLDGNANCELDPDDNYETIVGHGYCNYTYIVQTGG